MDKKNLTRLITGLIMGFAFLFCFIYGGLPLSIVLLIFIFVGTKELVEILKHKGFHPSLEIILFSDFVLSVLAYLNRYDMLLVTVTLFSIIAFMWVLFRGKQPYIANAATTVFGFIYSGLFTLHLIFLRDLGITPVYNHFLKAPAFNEGLWAAVIVFLCVVATDTGCYYFGTRFGKHKLAPTVSPNKSIEGAIGGTVSSLAIALAVGYFAPFAWYHSIIVGLLSAFFAQVGDLFESLIKRDAGVQDSSNVLPGHGGFLDRSDSYVFTLPVLYFYFKFFVYGTGTLDAILTFFKGYV